MVAAHVSPTRKRVESAGSAPVIVTSPGSGAPRPRMAITSSNAVGIVRAPFAPHYAVAMAGQPYLQSRRHKTAPFWARHGRGLRHNQGRVGEFTEAAGELIGDIQ